MKSRYWFGIINWTMSSRYKIKFQNSKCWKHWKASLCTASCYIFPIIQEMLESSTGLNSWSLWRHPPFLRNHCLQFWEPVDIWPEVFFLFIFLSSLWRFWLPSWLDSCFQPLCFQSVPSHNIFIIFFLFLLCHTIAAGGTPISFSYWWVTVSMIGGWTGPLIGLHPGSAMLPK